MRNFLLLFVFSILNIPNSFSQEFLISTNYTLTKIESAEIENFYKNVNDQIDETKIYLVDQDNNNLAEFKVFFESYDNDGEVWEQSKTKLDNINKIIKVKIHHCACYCDTEIFYWLVTDKGNWVSLPIIQMEDFEFTFSRQDYIFSKSRRNTIELYNFQDELIKESENSKPKVVRKSESILKTYTWDGNSIKELK